MTHFIEKIRKYKIPFLTDFSVYFDLGTHTTKIAIKDRGIVLREPTALAEKKNPKEYVFFGDEAKNIVGKTPDFLRVIRPMVGGIISDFDAEVALLRAFISKSVAPYTKQYWLKPPIRALSCIPSIATEIEQKAVEESILKTGCSSVLLVKKPVATAAGLGIDVFSHKPACVVDFGAGLIELSIISGGGIVAQRTLKTAGDHMDKTIGSYVYMKHGVQLGEQSCERLKNMSLRFDSSDETMLVRGKSLENGLPKSVKIRSGELREALSTTVNLVLDGIRELLELSAPEVVDEVYERGILFAGKVALLPGLADYAAGELKIPVHTSQFSDTATVRGLLELDKKREQLSIIRLN